MANAPVMLNNLRVVKGQSKRWQITVRRKNGARAKLPSGTRFFFTVARGGEVVFTKTSDDGSIRLVDAENGVATLDLEVEDTEKLEAGTSIYDLWVDVGGTPPKREPLVDQAELIVTERVTQFTS
jgi:hypothetical protein